MAKFKKFEVETCECGCITPLGYIHYNEDGIGTCVNCINDELISRLDKKNKQIRKLNKQIRKLKSVNLISLLQNDITLREQLNNFLNWEDSLNGIKNNQKENYKYIDEFLKTIL